MSEVAPQGFNPYEDCSEAVLSVIDYLGVDLQHHLVSLAFAHNMDAGFMRPRALHDRTSTMTLQEEPLAFTAVKNAIRRLCSIPEPPLDVVGVKHSAYKMNDRGYRTAGALAEAILSWQAENDDLPLGSVWSTERKITSRPFREYFAIFRMLSAYPEGVSLADLDGVIALNYSPRSVVSVMKRKLSLGVVTATESKSEKVFTLAERWHAPITKLVNQIVAIDDSCSSTEALQEKIEALANDSQKIGALLRLGAEVD